LPYYYEEGTPAFRELCGEKCALECPRRRELVESAQKLWLICAQIKRGTSLSTPENDFGRRGMECEVMPSCEGRGKVA